MKASKSKRLEAMLARIATAKACDLDIIFNEIASDTTENIIALAAIAKRKRDEGMITRSQFPLLGDLLLVAEGITLPEVYLKWASWRLIMDAVKRLNTADQKRAAEDMPFRVYDPSGSERMICISAMTPDQIRMVFNGDCVRTVEQQVAWLTDRKQKASVKAAATDTISVIPDPERHGYIIHGFLSCADLMRYAKTPPKKTRQLAASK